MNSYELSRNFINWAFENPSKIKPNHYALYFFSIEHCNRLGWKKEFGLPSTMAMEATGIKSHNTYMNTFNDLIGFGFFDCIERSKNQYSSNIIALLKFDKAPDKALDKAFIKHDTKQDESIDSIDKPIYKEPITNNIEDRKLKFSYTLDPYLDNYGKDLINDFYSYWTEPNKSNTKFRQELEKTWSLERRISNWSKNDKNFNINNKNLTNGKLTELTESIRNENPNL